MLGVLGLDLEFKVWDEVPKQPILKNQMAQNMEHEMDVGIL